MEKSRSKFDNIYGGSAFIGIALLTWQIFIYRKTIIEVKLLFIIALIATIIGCIFIFKPYRRHYNNYSNGRLIPFVILQSLFSIGFTVVSLFTLSNYYLANENAQVTTYEIIDRYSMSGSKRHRSERKPVFTIYYKNNFKKDLVFSHEFFDGMETYTHVDLEVHQGCWGFEILKNKSLH